MNRLARRSALAVFAALLLLPAFASARPRFDVGKEFTGENPLNVPRAEFAAAQLGVELLCQRRYPEALSHFELVGVDFPESPLGPVGRAVVHQAIMWEDGTDDRERAFQTEMQEADMRFRMGARDRQRRSWNQFLQAVTEALGAMYDVRYERYLAAFNKAWSAMDNVKDVHRAHPDFHDLQLAFGIYDYWASVYSERIKGLPKMADKRAEGVAAIQVAIDKGLLASAPARLALAITYWDAKEWDKAVAEAKAGQQLYPTNMINSIILARLQEKTRDYDGARATYEAALGHNPDHHEGWYRLGRLLARERSTRSQAKAAMSKAAVHAKTDPQKARALYRLALLERSSRDYDSAIALLEQAVKADPEHGGAKQRLESIHQEKARYDERRKERMQRAVGTKSAGRNG